MGWFRLQNQGNFSGCKVVHVIMAYKVKEYDKQLKILVLVLSRDVRISS